MPLNKRFLILTSDAGFGHRSAANSIAKALERQHPQDVTTVIVNPIFEEPASALLKRTEQNYDHTVKDTPNWYRFTYDISDSRSACALVETTLTLALHKNVKQIIQEVRPDGILNTNQMFNAPAGVVRSAMKRRYPFYTVVTDLADVHSMWFNAFPDRFFVASAEVRSKALASGIRPQKICISGIPVDPDFRSEHPSKAEMRLALGLDPQLPTLLIVGSRRVSGIFDHLMALERVKRPFQVVVIAGGDDGLYAKCTQRDWSFPILIRNYVTNMPEWMLCADVLVTKAGGLILSEGLAAGLPILLIDYLPGQEEGNVRFILDHRAGTVVKYPWEFAHRVDSWLRDDQTLLKDIAMNSRRLGHPDSAFVVADALWQATAGDLPQEGSHSKYRIFSG